MEESMKVFIGLLVVVIIIVLIVLLGMGLEYMFGIQWYGFMKKEKANVDREVFKNTKSYNEGMVQDLVKYKYEHDRAKTQEEKKIVLSMIRHRFANFDETKLNSDELKIFLKKAKYGGE